MVSDSSTVSEPSTSRTSPLEAETEAAASKSSHQRKSDHSHDKNSDSFYENQCCMCFRTYEDDVIEDTDLDCYRRWLHEESGFHPVGGGQGGSFPPNFLASPLNTEGSSTSIHIG